MENMETPLEILQGKHSDSLELFNDFGITSGGKKYATRGQIESLYDVARRTLADNINNLKEDGLISGAKIRHTASDGKIYNTEVFDLQETIKIGFRLRSDIALRLQDYASELMVRQINSFKEKQRMLELELSYAWNHSDNQDLYR